MFMKMIIFGEGNIMNSVYYLCKYYVFPALPHYDVSKVDPASGKAWRLLDQTTIYIMQSWSAKNLHNAELIRQQFT